MTTDREIKAALLYFDATGGDDITWKFGSTLAAALRAAEEREAMMRAVMSNAYGCLWADGDIDTPNSALSNHARRLLLASISKTDQAIGIQYAIDHFGAPGPSDPLTAHLFSRDEKNPEPTPLVAGWNACRTSIYAVCEDIRDREAQTYEVEGNEHAKGFVAGMRWAAKSIARGFNSMDAEDDDNLRAARALEPRS